MQQINHVLLIDDDPIFNMISKSLVKRAEFSPEVSTCSDANIALDELRTRVRVNYEEFPDVIFLDLDMPKMDGWAFLEEFQKFPEWSVKKCRVFILSSSISHRDVEKSRMYEVVCDFISKPLTIDKIETIWFPRELVAA